MITFISCLPIIFLRDKKKFFHLLKKRFLPPPPKNYGWSKRPINEIIGRHFGRCKGYKKNKIFILIWILFADQKLLLGKGSSINTSQIILLTDNLSTTYISKFRFSKKATKFEKKILFKFDDYFFRDRRLLSRSGL